MALTSAYLVAAKNLPIFLESLRSARAPDRFTLKFIEDLGFKSTNDRLFIPLLKSLGFLDESGTPKQRYFDFLDDSRWQYVLAEGIEEAYGDLFRLNKKAYNLSRSDLAGKIKSLTQGKYSDVVINNMTKTFSELAKLANFERPPTEIPQPGALEVKEDAGRTNNGSQTAAEAVPPMLPDPPVARRSADTARLIDGLTYRIEIVLPAHRDKSVYDAIFRSLKEHLL
jgi:hypothetical protein